MQKAEEKNLLCLIFFCKKTEKIYTEPKDTQKNGYRQVTRREENLSFFMPGIVKTKAKKEARSQQIRGFFSGNPSFFSAQDFQLKSNFVHI